MKLTDQTCTLEQAKRLHELGISQSSYLFWHLGKVSETWIIINSEHSDIDSHSDYSAFSVAELGIMLNAKRNETKHTFYHNPSGMYSHERARNPALFKTEAESRADYLIYLLEMTDLTADEVNKKLAE